MKNNATEKQKKSMGTSVPRKMQADKGQDDTLPEDILDLYMKPCCSVPTRINLFQVSKMFEKIMRVEMTRQARFCSSWAEPIVRDRAPVQRLSSEVPCVEEYQLPSHMRMRVDAESEITVQLDDSSRVRLQEVVAKVLALESKMRDEKMGDVRVFRLHTISRRPSATDESAREVLRSLSDHMRDTLHTLCVRRGVDVLPGFTALFPFFRRVFPRITTVDLHLMSADIKTMRVAFPELRSLRLSMTRQVLNWPSLAEMTGLQELKLRMLDRDDQDWIPPALEAIEQTTWLKSISLPEFGVSGLRALAGYTQLTSLSLSSRRANVVEVEAGDFQSALDDVARNSPGLLRLGLVIQPGTSIPGAWTQLEQVYVLHKTVIPPLESITDVVIEKSRLIGVPVEGGDAVHLLYNLLRPLPSNVRRLRAAYNVLPSALGCHDLVRLAWTPLVREGDRFKLADHISLLGAISCGHSVWPLLEEVLILQDRCNDYDARVTRSPEQVDEDEDVQDTYNAQMLETLGCRRTNRCIIKHLTVHCDNWMFRMGSFAAICKMQLLQSVTLIEMRVNLQQLVTLVKKPTMRLLELIGVRNVSEADARSLARESRGVCRVHLLALSEMDTKSSGALDWEL